MRLGRGATPQNANSCLERCLQHLQFKRRGTEEGAEGGVGRAWGGGFLDSGGQQRKEAMRVGAALLGVMSKKAGLRRPLRAPCAGTGPTVQSDGQPGQAGLPVSGAAGPRAGATGCQQQGQPRRGPGAEKCPESGWGRRGPGVQGIRGGGGGAVCPRASRGLGGRELKTGDVCHRAWGQLEEVALPQVSEGMRVPAPVPSGVETAQRRVSRARASGDISSPGSCASLGS